MVFPGGGGVHQAGQLRQNATSRALGSIHQGLFIARHGARHGGVHGREPAPCPRGAHNLGGRQGVQTKTTGQHTGGQRQPGTVTVSPGTPVPVHPRGTRHGLQLLQRTSQRTDACGRLHRPPGTLGTRGRGAWGVWGRRGSGKVIAGRGSGVTQRHRGETGARGGQGPRWTG